MRDGVKLALDVVRPMGDGPNTKRNTIVLMTRYWRGKKGSSETYARIAERFVPHGYAVVVGDVRGTGASFGVWRHHYSRAEVSDLGDVLSWIAAQPWSTGQVVSTGLSYPGSLAERFVLANHPALKGAMPEGYELDPYEDNYQPGGILNANHGNVWGNSQKFRDENVPVNGDEWTSMVTPAPGPGVRPAGPNGEADLQAAVREHDAAPSVWEGLQQVTFKDDRPPSWNGESWLTSSLIDVTDQISRSGTPMQDWQGWFDCSLTGAVRRFMRLSNPVTMIIGPWAHGMARTTYDPIRAADEAVLPTYPTLEANQRRFAELCFNGQAAREKGKVLHYYTLGEGWKKTHSWPVPGTKQRRLYMASGSRLSASPDTSGFDPLQVDRSLRPITSIWGAGMEPAFGDRQKVAEGRLAYISEPFTRALEITGNPVIHLNITSSREDGAFFAYLDGIKPNGELYYLTQGQLRALHRKVWTDSPDSAIGPQHSYLRRDGEPLVPGQPAVLTFMMNPISARIPPGHRLRIVLAGSESPQFANVPKDGEPPLLQFHRGTDGCYVDLPIIES
jgi:hypothetical protein